MGDRGLDGVRVWRGGEIESMHRVHVAVTGGDDSGENHGDPSTRGYFRSAAKPIQLVPLIEEGIADRLDLTGEEIAVMAASHGAEPFHLDAVRSILDKAGVSEDHLQCGPHEPLDVKTARRMSREGRRPAPIHNNCSGKHAGMLAVSASMGWPLETYRDREHPLQRRIRALVIDLSGEDEHTVGTAVDGCGVPTFSLSVTGMATAWARLAAADARRETDLDRAVGFVFDSIVAHPAHLAGTDRLTTVLIERAGGRVIVKEGYEGVYCAAVRSGAVKGRGPCGVAIKVEDGATRAAEVALVEILHGLRVLETDSDPNLAERRSPVIRNRAGEIAGHIDSSLPLSRADGRSS